MKKWVVIMGFLLSSIAGCFEDKRVRVNRMDKVDITLPKHKKMLNTILSGRTDYFKRLAADRELEKYKKDKK